MLKAVFLNRDGTLYRMLQQSHGKKHPQKIPVALREGVLEALLLLKKNHVQTFVFSGQKRASQHKLSGDALTEYHAHVQALLHPQGQVDGFYTAEDTPHAVFPENIILRILQEQRLQPEDVVVISDTYADYEAAHAVGVRVHCVRSEMMSAQEFQQHGIILHESLLHIIRGLL